MIKIDLLKNHPNAVPAVANIWHEVLGKVWMPEIGIEEIEFLYYEELQHNMPLSYIALYDNIPVGSCTLKLNEDFRPGLGPWLSDLLVEPKYQKQGIGKMLVNVARDKAKEFGFEKLYVFVFEPSTLSEYYERLGWKKTCIGEFKSHSVTVMEIGL